MKGIIMRRLKNIYKIGKRTVLDLGAYLFSEVLSAPPSKDNIRPCRFCGSEDVEIVFFPPISEFVLCNGCLCQGPAALSSKNGVMAVDYWNNGTTPFILDEQRLK